MDGEDDVKGRLQRQYKLSSDDLAPESLALRRHRLSLKLGASGFCGFSRHRPFPLSSHHVERVFASTLIALRLQSSYFRHGSLRYLSPRSFLDLIISLLIADDGQSLSSRQMTDNLSSRGGRRTISLLVADDLSPRGGQRTIFLLVADGGQSLSS